MLEERQSTKRKARLPADQEGRPSWNTYGCSGNSRDKASPATKISFLGSFTFCVSSEQRCRQPFSLLKDICSGNRWKIEQCLLLGQKAIIFAVQYSNDGSLLGKTGGLACSLFIIKDWCFLSLLFSNCRIPFVLPLDGQEEQTQQWGPCCLHRVIKSFVSCTSVSCLPPALGSSRNPQCTLYIGVSQILHSSW